MFRAQKTVAAAASASKRALRRLARPAGTFDASRYFRGDHSLGFYNTGTKPMRALAREIYLVHRDRWTVRDAVTFADLLMPDRHLEVKSIGLEVLARYRKEFAPPLLARCQRWLAKNHSANWATTDEMCGVVIGPLLVKHPELMPQMRAWARHKNMWVRRASIVGLLPPIRRGDSEAAVDLVCEIARQLHPDPNDLIHKAVGWALREAGKIDPVRLERYLRAHVTAIPRTTFRYAIERFEANKRAQLLSLGR
jgi:3-methyladenine DNA glycosylase AlkD